MTIAVCVDVGATKLAAARVDVATGRVTCKEAAGTPVELLRGRPS